jgi:undecaprenyl diphosphate synthase
MKENIDKSNLPQHIAVIMDGNGRWAKQKGGIRINGHKQGIEAVREATEGAVELGVKYLTLYTFSTENWNRPKFEVDFLMQLLVDSIEKEIPTLKKNNVRLNVIGDFTKLPKNCQKALAKGMADTAENNGLMLNLALNYSGKWDIIEATKQIAQKVKNGELEPNQITDDLFASHLSTPNMPDVDLMIRTGGDHRISNYLLWQMAYAELYFMQLFWPEFKREHLFEAIYSYQNRERRFGLISEQLTN